MHDILKYLRSRGARMTLTRRLVLDIFQDKGLPLTETEIRDALSRRGRKANKTTVYRELEVLQDMKAIVAVEFGDGKKRFELAFGPHHHHLVCTGCGSVQDIALHDEVKHIERRITKQKKFQTTRHVLEFFGLCAKCCKAA